jgi:hypothetical protein
MAMMTLATSTAPIECDFADVTALEYLAIADRERIHTEFLRWLLSSASPLSDDARLGLVAAVFPAMGVVDIVDVWTEFKRLDLVLKARLSDGSDTHLIVENKLKALEHSRQLTRYDAVAEELGCVGKFFLTLIAEPPTNTHWQPVSYRAVYAAIREACRGSEDHRHRGYLHDYRDLLARLVAAAELVVASPEPYAAVVFGDPTDPPEDGFAEYVKRLRMRTVLQRAWMRALGVRFAESMPRVWESWSTGETRGNALLTLHLSPVTHSGELVDVGIQLQTGQLKVFASPTGYKSGASAGAKAAVRSVLEIMAGELGVPDARRTPSRSKGFSSFQPGVPVPASYKFDAWARTIQSLLERVAKARGVLVD